METISCSGDLKNGHMIDVLERKLPSQVSKDWAKHKQKEKVGMMASEDRFGVLMEFLKAEKEVTKSLLHKQETSSDKSKTHSSYVTGQTFTVHQKRLLPKHAKIEDKGTGRLQPLCMACRGTKNPPEAMHWTTDCEVWRSLKLP